MYDRRYTCMCSVLFGAPSPDSRYTEIGRWAVTKQDYGSVGGAGRIADVLRVLPLTHDKMICIGADSQASVNEPSTSLNALIKVRFEFRERLNCV